MVDEGLGEGHAIFRQMRLELCRLGCERCSNLQSNKAPASFTRNRNSQSILVIGCLELYGSKDPSTVTKDFLGPELSSVAWYLSSGISHMMML